MADLTITAFEPVFDNAHISPHMLSAPLAVDTNAGAPLKYNAISGKLEKMASTDAAHLFVGLLIKTTKAGYMGVAFRGLAYIESLGSLTIGQLVALSATAGALADTQAAGAKTVARLVPMHESGGTFKKMIEIFNLPYVVP